jgi:TPR repeat protein
LHRLFKQAADLGVTDASIRLGQLLERGKGTQQDVAKALKAYQQAAKAGNFFALAFAAQLVSRSAHSAKANDLWGRFFENFNTNPDASFKSASRGELLHDYIKTQLRLGLEPQHLRTLKQYRLEIVGHHQQMLEYAAERQFGTLEEISNWIKLNLGPWPITPTYRSDD